MRPLDIRCFDVRDGRVVAVDGVVPLAVEADLATGRVSGVWTWETAAGRRGRRVATDVVLTGAGVVVASPAAGGLVRIDRTTGVATVLAMDAEVGRLVRDGETVWAVGATAEEADPTWPRRPLEWHGPPAGAGEPDDRDDNFDDIEDPTFRIEPSTPVWRVDGESVTAYDLGGRVEGLAILGDEVVAVVTRPTDPLVMRRHPGGFTACERPATVLRGHPAHGLAVVGTVPDGCGSLHVDGGAVWLVGFEPDDEPEAVWRLGAGDGSPVRVDLPGGPVPDPLAVAAGRVVGLEWGRGSRRAHVVGLGPGGARSHVELPSVHDDAWSDLGLVWFLHDRKPAVVGLDVEQGTVTEVVLDLDCTPYVPTPVPPPGVDLAAYETGVRDDLRAAFFGGWTSSDDGRVVPYITGVTFESVEVHGEFPDTQVVALFRSEDRPGVRFARRWTLYDEAGNPEDERMEYADVGLMEDVDTGCLPPVADCVPDAEGIVWLDDGWQD